MYTDDTRKPWAEAVAIEGKNFVCVGTNEEVLQYAKFNASAYETVDLGGKTVLPGLIDGHNHPALISKSSWVIYGPDTTDKEELFENIREAAKKHNIFTIPVNEIHTIDPVCTYFDGQECHFPNPLKV